MSSQFNTNSTQNVSESVLKAISDFENLNVDDRLAALYFIYTKMGDSVTPAAPSAANPNLAPILLEDFLDLSDDEQLQIMRDIANRQDTDYSRAYGALTANNQLLVWFTWAEEMGNLVVDIPGDAATATVNKIVSQVENFSFEEQIFILREMAINMGYTDVKPIPTQAETGKTSSL
ncbi:orange carotenoid protein N-terminal domain-containing protein [Calothrix sp. 336/3]|uniref:orange carotenoid protein N-terminal domain-containing protein n=1 Tax=Calothrix sp. 336/3 TaxID=1337936 RepID=UPI0004E434B2|nr:orange carotenoid protein N-terminal domain-containing protein [Calothrix sp. 336/3]AKG21603.1 orange carotenoid protein [Calothrix sp. 336/3]